MEAAELKAHDAKLRNCEGSGEEEAVGHKAAGAAGEHGARGGAHLGHDKAGLTGNRKLWATGNSENTKLCGARPHQNSHQCLGELRA